MLQNNAVKRNTVNHFVCNLRLWEFCIFCYSRSTDTSKIASVYLRDLNIASVLCKLTLSSDYPTLNNDCCVIRFILFIYFFVNQITIMHLWAYLSWSYSYDATWYTRRMSVLFLWHTDDKEESHTHLRPDTTTLHLDHYLFLWRLQHVDQRKDT